ncbi:hypothetical protein [Lentzea sp.]|uniref:hypothetical protein n=1 Tax=Lentzea sp. TaxID=56099 RepID=UPI002ED3140E
MGKQGLGRVLAAVALTVAAVSAAAVPAAAGQDSAQRCAAGEVVVDRFFEGYSPSPDTSRLFVLTLKGHEGVDCVLSGPLVYTRFYDTNDQPIDVPFSAKPARLPVESVHVTEDRPAFIYIWAPKTGTGFGYPVGRTDFNAPTAPLTPLSVTWPRPVYGPLQFTWITEGVS